MSGGTLRGAATLAFFGLMGCGGAPAPVEKAPVVQAPVVAEARKAGVSEQAERYFVDGVAALNAQPAEFTRAVEAFGQATKDSPEYDTAWLNLAYSYERLGRFEEAVKAYRVLGQKGVTDRGLSLALGRSLLASGEVAAAIVEFESVLRKDSNDLQARTNLAAAYMAKGDLETSLRYVKEVLAVQPKNVPAIVNLGLIYARQNKLQLALLMFQKAIGYDANNARAHNNLGLVFYRLDDIPAAVASFEKAIKSDSTLDEARLNVASVYLDYLDYPAALEQFRAVRARFPKHYVAMVGEADTLYGIGEFEAAVKLYEETLSIRSDNTEVLLRTGKLYEEQLNQPKKALEFYIRYRDAAKVPADHPINATIKFLQEMDTLKVQPTTAAPEEGATPAEASPTPAEASPAVAPTEPSPAASPSPASPTTPGST